MFTSHSVLDLSFCSTPTSIHSTLIVSLTELILFLGLQTSTPCSFFPHIHTCNVTSRCDGCDLFHQCTSVLLSCIIFLKDIAVGFARCNEMLKTVSATQEFVKNYIFNIRH